MNRLIQTLTQGQQSQNRTFYTQAQPQPQPQPQPQAPPLQKAPQRNISLQSTQFDEDEGIKFDQDFELNQLNQLAEEPADLENTSLKHPKETKKMPLGVTKQIQKQPINKVQTKKKLKPLGMREPWTDKHKILTMSKPQRIEDKKSRKKYKIHIQFINEKGKRKSCTIRFGDKKSDDFVDHHNIDRRNMTLLRLNRNCDSVLNPNYWRILLLNTVPSVEEAWNNYISNPDHNFLKF